MATVIDLDEKLLIGGEWTEAEGGDRFDVTDPATGGRVGSVPNGTQADVTAAIDAAAAALPAWRSTTALERARILRRSADIMRERADEIARTMTSEQGKPLAEAKGEVEYAASFFEWFGGEAERIYGASGAIKTFRTPPYPSTHNLGTARMSARAQDGVCNQWGQTHDIPNLFISDGSQFTTGGSENPTLTIVSLAIRQADYIASQMAQRAL